MISSARSLLTRLTYFWVFLAVLALISPAHAGLIISLESKTATPGSSDFFDVLITNDGATDATIGAFTFQLSVSGSSPIQFTSADINPSVPYIFSGNSFVENYAFDFSFDTFPNTGFSASDLYDNLGGALLSAGETLGLGRVGFSVAGDASAQIVTVTLETLGTSLADGDANALEYSGVNGTITITDAPAAAPEPSSLVLFGMGMGLLACKYLRRRRLAV